MKAASLGRCILVLLLLFVATAVSTRADEITMQNGDRYTGKLGAIDDNIVVLNSEMLGTLKIRRDKVASISLGAKPTTNAAPATASTNEIPKVPHVATLTSRATAAGPNPNVNLNSSLSHEIAANSNLVNEVRSEVLTGGGPKAAAKFDELVDGLATGNINVDDLRKQAASVATQLRELRGNADGESAEIFDEYLGVLDQFVRETGGAQPSNAAQPAATKRPSPSAPPAAKPATSTQTRDE